MRYDGPNHKTRRDSVGQRNISCHSLAGGSMNARKRWTTTAYRLVVPYREAEQLGIDLGPSEAQQMLLGMYPDARYGVVWLTRHFDMVTYATVFRIHSRVIIPAKVSMQDPLGQRDQEQLQEETREVTINDPSSPTLKITYSQG